MGKSKLISLTDFKPAVLRKTKSCWYIEYYQWHPAEEKSIRFRVTEGINRIKDLKKRKKKAKELILEINSRLPIGWPFENVKAGNLKIDLQTGLQIGLREKLKSKSSGTRNSYNSIVSIFSSYLKNQGWLNIPVASFKKRHAIMFLDYSATQRKLSSATYNNYINKMKSIFFELVEREYIEENPFLKIKKKKTGSKKRRAFTKKERGIVIKKIRATDSFLYLAVLLQYHCFIRPNEIRQLKKHMFDLENGMIRIPGEISKNKESEIVTIPNCIKDEVRMITNLIPGNYFVFGPGLKPSKEKGCSKNYMGKMHRKIINNLFISKELVFIEGLSFYSWKDTGATELFKNRIDTNEIMRQIRHKDLSYTQRYCQSLYGVNTQIRDLDNRI